MEAAAQRALGEYRSLDAGCVPWDGRYPTVAHWLAQCITDCRPTLCVEHFESTSVPGCEPFATGFAQIPIW